MTRVQYAAELEAFAREVERIRGVSARNPHIFVEDKSEVVARLRARAKDLRTVAPERKPPPVMRPGIIVIPAGLTAPRPREVRVEVRRRRRA